MNSLAQQIKSWRITRGLSQASLAKKAGLARPNLIDLELGRRDCTVTTLMRLAVALELSPGQLLDQSPPATEKTRLDRHECDAVARAMIMGTGNLPASSKQLVSDFRPLFRSLLEANNVAVGDIPRLAERRYRYQLETLYSRELLAQVIARVRKLLPALSHEH